MNNNTLQRDMTRGPLLPQMISFTLPFILANLLQTFYTMADLAIVGHFAPEGDLAAVSISGQVAMLLTLVGINLANGGQVYSAQLFGQNRRDEINEAVGTFFSFVAIAALVAAALCIFLARPVLGWLNTPELSFDAASGYLRICGVGMIFVFGYNAVCAILRGFGQSMAPTVFVAISSVMNILGDLILVKGLHMGALGAAYATAGSQFLAFLVSLIFLYRNREEAGFDFRLSSFRIHADKLRVILKLAFPLIVMQIALNVSMLLVGSYINRFGVAAASVAGIGNKLYSIVNIVSGAFCAAMATIVGQNIGAGQTDRIRHAMLISVVIDLCFFALIAAAALGAPRFVFRIFTAEEDIIELAPHYLRIAVWAYLSFALMHPTLGLINGVGNTTLNMIIGVLDGVVARIGLSMLLGNRLGMWGYFWGYSLAGLVSVILNWAYYFSGKWKYRKLL